MIDEQTIKNLFANHKRGRFEIKSVLGAGAMGTVVRARDTVLKVARAIKVFNPELIEHSNLVKRFENEASIMAGIDHPNIVRVFDIDEVDGHFYFVLEWIGGGSLSDHMFAFGGMPPRQAVDVILKISKALQKAHKEGVIHRDIKPDNILLTKEGVPKVTDFGIAHINEESLRLTGTAQTLGTLGYMAPEQMYEAASVDERSDLHGVAVMLWALMSGRHPPGTSFVSDITHRPELLECVPECLHASILKACAYLPKDRHKTVQEFIDELDAVFDSLPEIPEGSPKLGTALDFMDSDEPRPDLLTPTDPGATFLPNKTQAPELKLATTGRSKVNSATDSLDISLVSVQTEASPKRISETQVYTKDASSPQNKKPNLVAESKPEVKSVVLEVIQGGKSISEEELVVLDSADLGLPRPQTGATHKQAQEVSEEKSKVIFFGAVSIFVVGISLLAWSFLKDDSVENDTAQSQQELLLAVIAKPDIVQALVEEPDVLGESATTHSESAIDVTTVGDLGTITFNDAQPTSSVDSALVKAEAPSVKVDPAKKTDSVKKRDQTEKKAKPKDNDVRRVTEVVVGLQVSGTGSASVWLVGSNGRFKLPGKIPVGTYRVLADFEGQPAGTVVLSSFVVEEGSSKKIVCNSVFANCKAR